MFDFCDFLPRIRNLQKVRMGFVGSSRESWTRMAKESQVWTKVFCRPLRRVAHSASPYLNHPAPRYSPFSLVTYGPYQVGCRVASP
jgi:hypothetical protein